jgi:hypothetical protein
VIAVEDNEPVDLRQCGERTLHRIARAARRILDHGNDVAGALKPVREIGGFGSYNENTGVGPRAFAGA